jgi:hypothetical protein
MSQTKRKILFFIFLIAFFALAPYILLYASGYSLDWKHPLSGILIQKTGMAIVYSEPAGANIFLDGKKQKNFNISLTPSDNTVKTPAKLKNIMPGSYDLKIELPGYWPWTRRIKIFPGQITHVLDIVLYKKNLPILISKSQSQETYPSNDRKKVVINTELVELKNETSEKISSSSVPTIWSSDGTKIISGTNIINLKDRNKSVLLEKIIGPEISNIKWLNNNEISYIYKNKLGRFDIDRQNDSTLIDNDDFLDYLPQDNNIIIAVRRGFSAKLKVYSLSSKKIEKEVDLPPSDGYIFLPGEGKTINLYDQKYKILYLVDVENQTNPLLEAINNGKYFQWFNKETLFFANDSEIWLLDLKNNNRRLLLRWSQPLKGILKTDKDNYVIFYTENDLNILTWDKGDEKLQVTELLKLEKIASPFASDNYEALYFFGKIGSQEGLYKLGLK